MSEKLTQLGYVKMYCDLVSGHCNELMMSKDSNEDITPIEKLALAVSLLNSSVRSLRATYIEGTKITYMGETGSRIVFKVEHDGEFISYAGMHKARVLDHKELLQEDSDERRSSSDE